MKSLNFAGWVLLLAMGPAALTGCGDPDEAAFDRALASRRGQNAEERARAATRALEVAGARVDPSTGRPIGYPVGFPLVPAYTAHSGGVDPGVNRTSTQL
jgi:hypothetical protein